MNIIKHYQLKSWNWKKVFNNPVINKYELFGLNKQFIIRRISSFANIQDVINNINLIFHLVYMLYLFHLLY